MSERVLRLQPGNRSLLIARVRRLAGQREWKAAADVLTRLSALDPPDAFSMQHEADLRSWMGDGAGYRRVCRRMLESFGTTTDPTIARRTLLSCLLEGDTLPDRRMLPRLLGRFRGNPAASDDAFSRLAEGLYEYREGRFGAAVEILRPLEAEPSSPPDIIPPALSHIIQSMAHARLGHPDEARRQLTTAKAMQNQTPFDPGSKGPLPANWNDWLRYDTLRREAEGLLRDAAFPDDPFAPGRR